MILIITNKDDITSDLIVNRLNKKEIEYYRFNTEELGLSVYVNFDFRKERYLLYDRKKGLEIDVNKIKSVYYRRPKLPNIEKTNLSSGIFSFVKNEYSFLLEGLYKLLQDKYWISPVYSIREAENKIFQIVLARELGFVVPDSLITSIPYKAGLFLKRHPDSIVKPIKSGFLDNEAGAKVIFTSRITKKNKRNIYKIEFCPTYFQNEIHKEYDIRVTVVGKKVFAARIDSQSFKETKTDWRKGENVLLKHEAIKLPYSIEKKCLALLKYFNLEFSAIDLILNKRGEYIFLEMNPNGQWAWIEKRLGFDISGEILNHLSRGK
jgi:glutathione synthase/RimK-type ligase-like ATP-grasp enzyme